MAARLLSFRRRVVLISCWVSLWLTWAILAWYPISTRFGHAAIAGVVLLIWAGAIGLSRRCRPVCAALLGLTAAAAILLFLPGGRTSPAAVRDAYVRSLATYQDAPYAWGGENRYGIDCSGLVRKALVWADLGQGLRHLDGKLLRASLDLWWHDASASAMGQGYAGRARCICTPASINELDHTRILPGDYATPTDGSHVLVYLGDLKWMEADPGAGKVIVSHVPADWLNRPVNVMRWVQFE
jgi:hypothetical protein